jgi:succinoglycan biosynthesis transport protein ExoP
MSTGFPEPAPEEAADLTQYIAVLKRRKWSILGIIGLVFLSAMFFSFRQTPVYESTAKVHVKPPIPQVGQVAQTPVDLATEREIAASQAVANLAAGRIQPPQTPQDLMAQLEVSVPADTQVLVITFADPNAFRAQEGAAAFADAYLAYKRQQTREALDEQQRPLRQRIDQINSQLGQLRRAIQENPEGPSLDQQSQLSELNSTLAVVKSQLDPLSATVIDPGAIIQEADFPSEPASPNHLLNAGLALFVGLALAVGLAFLRERLDDRLRGREDLEMRIGAPVLGIIPKVPGWKRRDRPRLVALEEPKSSVSEAYRTLRTSILFAASRGEMKTILVASAHTGEGKTTSVANLGVVLAQGGKKVVIISADVRKPRLHHFFDVENNTGLVNVLIGEAVAAEALVTTNQKNLLLMPSGPVPSLPAELLGSEAMGQLIERLGRTADFILIDTPALLAVSDALSLAPLTDGVIFVADAESTTRVAVAHARSQLEQMGANVFAAVINDYDPSKARPYPYYRYYYAYTADRDGGAVRPAPHNGGTVQRPAEQPPAAQRPGEEGFPRQDQPPS